MLFVNVNNESFSEKTGNTTLLTGWFYQVADENKRYIIEVYNEDFKIAF